MMDNYTLATDFPLDESFFTNCQEQANRGFTMLFPNGIVVSVRWGTMNYSDNNLLQQTKPTMNDSATSAECAAWSFKTKEFVKVPEFGMDGDDVLPRMNTSEVARFIYNASLMSL
jgi:hypothetical protein